MKVAQLPTLSRSIREATGVDVARCYQCGKCTAGCPMAKFMDLTTSQVMRLCQIDDPKALDRLLSSDAIWACAGCLTCTQRCPKELDPAAVMDVLREMSSRQGKVSPRRKKILAFHQAFLTTVRKTGRMSEFALVRRYKMSSGDLFGDMLLAPVMMAKGKLSLKTHKIKGRDQIKKIFQACQARAKK